MGRHLGRYMMPLYPWGCLTVLALVGTFFLGLCGAAASPVSRVHYRKTTWDMLSRYSFDDYVTEFGRTYASPDERAYRRDIFERRLAAMVRHNADPSKTWKMGVNHLTDRTEAEQRQLLGHRSTTGLPTQGGLSWSSRDGVPLLGTNDAVAPPVDWRQKGVVTPVKDQGWPLS